MFCTIVDWKDTMDEIVKLSKWRAFIFKNVEKWRHYRSFRPQF